MAHGVFHGGTGCLNTLSYACRRGITLLARRVTRKGVGFARSACYVADCVGRLSTCGFHICAAAGRGWGTRRTRGIARDGECGTRVTPDMAYGICSLNAGSLHAGRIARGICCARGTHFFARRRESLAANTWRSVAVAHGV